MATSWFTAALDAAKRVVATKGEDFVLMQLDSDNGVTEQSRTLEKDLDYITIRVNSSRIVNVRVLTSTFYGSLQSRVHYLHGDRGYVEFQRIIVPEKMRELDPANADKVIVVDKPIIGPIPYIGELSLELGLFAVKGTDLAAPYLDLLTSIADTAGSAYLSAAIPFVEPLRKGADLLFGNDKQSTLEIGMDKNWKDISTGTWLLMRAPKDQIDIAQLHVDFRDGTITGKNRVPFRRFPYITFTIESSRRRDDWMTIPDLKQSWDAVASAARKGKTNEAEQLLRQFVLIAKWSCDLVPADAARLAKKAEDQFALLQPTTTVAASASRPSLVDFSGLNLYDC